MLSGLPPELSVFRKFFPPLSRPKIANGAKLSEGARSRRIAVKTFCATEKFGKLRLVRAMGFRRRCLYLWLQAVFQPRGNP